MKNLKTNLPLYLLGFILLFTSCDKTELDKQTLPTLIEVFENNTELSSLSQALTTTGLDQVLATNGAQGYTVFAPTNDAFNTYLAANGYATLDAVPSALLKEILLNHVIVGKLKAVNLPASAYIKTLATGEASSENTLSMYVNKADGVLLNGVSRVTNADIVADNGIIHIVDAVIDLPTIVTHVVANPNFSNLVSALTRNDQPDFVGLLSSSASGSFTVFAPYNTAFVSLVTELNLTSINDLSQSILEKTLQNHVVGNANDLSLNFANAQVFPTLSGDDLTLIINNTGTNIKDYNNREADLSLFDVQCRNGVIHGIDKVLLPNLN